MAFSQTAAKDDQPLAAGSFCVGVLAVGSRYRAHAQLLLGDLQQQAPTVPVVLLSDRPADFAGYAQVRAVRHQLQSVKGYHDKRYVLEQALAEFQSCLYLDADMRVLGPLPEADLWLPGLTARAGCSILKHNSGPQRQRDRQLIEAAAQHYQIDLTKTQWLHEFMFTLSRQAGAEISFLRWWQRLGDDFERQGCYAGEGNVMGLAAAKAGLSLRFDPVDRFAFFKDVIEQVRIRQGQADPAAAQIYFERHRQIEYPPRSRWHRGLLRLRDRVAMSSRWLQLQLRPKPR